MNIKNLIPRILSLPFMLVILIIPLVVLYFEWIKRYFLYGGEIIAYEDKDERKTIKDLYFLMKDKGNGYE